MIFLFVLSLTPSFNTGYPTGVFQKLCKKGTVMGMRILKGLSFLTLLMFTLSFLACGSGGGDGDVVVLNMDGTLVITDGPANPAKFGAAGDNLPTEQPFQGTFEIKITQEFNDGLQIEGIRLLVKPIISQDLNLIMELDPQVNPLDNNGTLFKRENGVPFGTSSITINTQVLVPDEPTLVLGGLVAQAENDDPNRLPILGNIPVISFLFNGQQKNAEIKSLMILLTPSIIEQLE